MGSFAVHYSGASERARRRRACAGVALCAAFRAAQRIECKCTRLEAPTGSPCLLARCLEPSALRPRKHGLGRRAFLHIVSKTSNRLHYCSLLRPGTAKAAPTAATNVVAIAAPARRAVHSHPTCSQVKGGSNFSAQRPCSAAHTSPSRYAAPRPSQQPRPVDALTPHLSCVCRTQIQRWQDQQQQQQQSPDKSSMPAVFTHTLGPTQAAWTHPLCSGWLWLCLETWTRSWQKTAAARQCLQLPSGVMLLLLASDDLKVRQQANLLRLCLAAQHACMQDLQQVENVAGDSRPCVVKQQLMVPQNPSHTQNPSCRHNPRPAHSCIWPVLKQAQHHTVVVS